MAILTRQEMAEKSAQLQSMGKIVVFTNGCFDLIHSGHIEILKKAREEGDYLFVGINSDRSVKRLKGDARPVLKAEERAIIVNALKPVSDVTIFDEDTPEQLIRNIQPDVLVKGSDYKGNEIVGTDEVIGRGGRVVRIPLIEGISSSKIISGILDGLRREKS